MIKVRLSLIAIVSWLLFGGYIGFPHWWLVVTITYSLIASDFIRSSAVSAVQELVVLIEELKNALIIRPNHKKKANEIILTGSDSEVSELTDEQLSEHSTPVSAHPITTAEQDLISKVEMYSDEKSANEFLIGRLTHIDADSIRELPINDKIVMVKELARILNMAQTLTDAEIFAVNLPPDEEEDDDDIFNLDDDIIQ